MKVLDHWATIVFMTSCCQDGFSCGNGIKLNQTVCLVVLCLSQLLTGCASGPTYLEKRSSIAPLDPRLGRIFFVRKSGIIGSGYRPKLTLNGVLVGKSIPGGFFFTDRRPGEYTLLAPGPTDIIEHPATTFNFIVNAGQTVYIQFKFENMKADFALLDAGPGEKLVQDLKYDGSAEDPVLAAKRVSESIEAEKRREKETEEEHERERVARKLAEENRQREIIRETDSDESGKELFKLQPDDQFTVSQVTEFLITWKNRHLDNVLKISKTADLLDYVDQIEHTVFRAMDASEKEKDQAQRLVTSGESAEREHTDLARAYRLRIEVLKPILQEIKNEIANRDK